VSSKNFTSTPLSMVCLGLILTVLFFAILGAWDMLEASDLRLQEGPAFHLNMSQGDKYPIAEVICGGQVAFRIRAPLGHWTVFARGREVVRRLRGTRWCPQMVHSVRPGEVNGYPVVLVQDSVLVTVDSITAGVNSSAPEDLASCWAGNLRVALRGEPEKCGSEPEEQEKEPISMVASWYGERFAGQSTASGEIFDPERFTAAHRWLPFGTELTVVCPETNRSVLVVVNDRGPFVEGRDLDLSRAAAERLGLLRRGVDRVKVFIRGE